MNNYIISMYDKNQNEAGPKAKVDVVNFLKQDNFKSIVFAFNGARKAELMSYKQAVWDIPHELKKHEMNNVLFQYPAFNERTNQKIVQEVKKKKGASLFFLLHDVESLRAHFNEQNFIEQEIAFFNQSDGLIVHNTSMLGWLRKNGVKKPMISLEIFDYDNPQSMNQQQIFDKSICFAGNLAKANFMHKWDLEEKLYLFGSNQSQKYPANVLYQGSFSPEELPSHLTQNFGLIWDGESLEKCTGTFGNYLKYNDPHKTSLYLSSGLPVIIWKKAALSSFVKDNGVGIVIDSLKDLDKCLATVSLAEYQEMCANVQKIGQKIRTGYFIRHAVPKLTAEM